MAVPNSPPFRVPKPLRDIPNWLDWRYQHFRGETKPRKVPYYPNGGVRKGRQGSAEDRAKLASFKVAIEAMERHGFTGVGFAPLPGFGIIALDFDGCVKNGVVDPRVLAIVSCTYAEFSPSGNGIRAFFRGDIGNHKSHQKDWPEFGFETFSTSGFVTVTGNALPHVGLTIDDDHIELVTDEVMALCNERWKKDDRRDVDENDPLSRKRKLGLSVKEMEDALRWLDPDLGRDNWIRVGMALHHEREGDDTGFALWNEWSESGTKYPGEDALMAQWKSFDRPRSKARLVTMGTVLHLAKEAREASASLESGLTKANGYSPPLLSDRDIANTTSRSYKRRPLVEGVCYLGELMNLSSQGGLGKSTYISALALAVATGRDLINAKIPHRRRVLIINGEDSRGEITMKIHAGLLLHNIPDTDVKGQIFTFGAEDSPIFCLIETNDSRQVVVRPAALRALENYILEKDAGLVIIDPLVSFFPGDMNSNGIIGSVMLGLKRIAVNTDCAVVIVQHVAKGTDADSHGAEAASGAASAVNLARTAFGIMGVSELKAPSLGIMPDEAKYFFRLINTKANLSIRSDDALFRRQAVPMDNGTDEFPDQDVVPVAVPFFPPEGGLAFPTAVLRDVLVTVAAGDPDGDPLSPSAGKFRRSFAPFVAATLQTHYAGLATDVLLKFAKAILAKLLEDGWVIIAKVQIPKQDRTKGSNAGQALFVRWTVTPWASETAPGSHVC